MDNRTHQLEDCLESTISSISFHIGSQSHTFRTVWLHRHVLPLITNKLSLLVNCRVKLTGTSREDCAESATLALKLGGSAPSSGPFRLAACVLGTGRNSVSTLGPLDKPPHQNYRRTTLLATCPLATVWLGDAASCSQHPC